MRTLHKVATAWLGYGILLVLLGLFLVDLRTPRGLAVGGLYAIVVLASLRFRRPYLTVGVAASASLVTLVTRWQSPAGGDAGFADHLLVLLAIWVAAYVATQNRRVLQAWEDSESRWRSIAENPFDYVSIVDRDGVFRYLNQAPPKECIEDFVGRETIFNRVTPEAVPAARAALQQLFSNGKPAYLEVRARKTDQWFGCNLGPIEQGGKIVAASVLAREITARKKAVDALRASEEKSREQLEELEDVYRSVPVGHCLVDRELRYVRTNEWLSAMNQVPMADHVGRRVREIAPELAETVERTCRLVLETGQPVRNLEIEGFAPRTREKHHWLVNYFPWDGDGGEARGVHMVVVDITASKKAAQALERSEERFRAVFDNAAAGIALIDPQGRFQRANPALCQALGYSEAELQGRTVDEVTYADDVHLSRQALADVRDGRKNVARFKKRYRSKDGAVIWTKAMVAALDSSEKCPRHLVAVIADITEQEQAQQALRESEAVRQSIMESSPDFIAMLDREGKYRFANRVAPGYRVEEVMGCTMSSLVTEEIAQVMATSFQRVVETGLPDRFEVNHKMPDGSYCWFESNVGPVIKDGAVTALIVSSRDVTARKRAEQALRESEDRYRNLIELSPNAILLKRDGRVIYSNSVALRLFGAGSANEVIGKSFYELFPPHSQSLIREKIKNLSGGKTSIIEGEIRAFDGRTLCVEVVASTVLDHGETAIQVVLHDITERKQTGEALARSEQHFRSLIENSTDVFSIVNRDGTSRYHSPSLDRVLGYSPEELRGTDPFDLVHPDDAAAARARFCEGLRAPGTHRPVEVRMRHRDGSWRWVEITANNQLNNPALDGITLTSRDVTQRKKAQEEKEQLEAQLWQAQKIEALGVLAGGIAHDFNNLLTSVAGFTMLAAEDTPIGSSARTHLEEAMGACDRARDLVRQMLTFGRRETPQKKALDIATDVHEAVRLARATIPASIEIRQQIDSDCGKVLADPGQLHQVLMNLCTNAYQAIAPARGTLDVELAPVVVNAALAATLPGLHAGRYVKLSVRDNGPGIDPAIRDRIFEPFVTTKGVGEGSGLGLSVVHGIVTSHGGAIAVESGPGRGSCFSVYFPQHDGLLSQRAGDAPVLAPTSPTTPGRTEHILFVDDEEAVLRLGRQILERLGYRVTALRYGLESLDAFKERPDGFDAVISDISMPQMSGVELAVEIKRIRPDVPVILTTGFHKQINAESAKRLGVREVLFKPFTAEQLGNAVLLALAEEPAPPSTEPRAASNNV